MTALNTSPIVILVLIQLNTVLKASHTVDNAVIIPCPALGINFPILLLTPVTIKRSSENPLAIEDKTPLNPLVSKPLFKDVKKLPIAEVTDNMS